jgi:hypothetical protein
MTWKQALALAAALGVTVVPAAADMSLPPAQYDIGGTTEADAMINYIDRFGSNGPEVIRVQYPGAKAVCDRINYQRYGAAYPEGDWITILLGCLIRDRDNGNPILVYSTDPNRPWLAVTILRHEAGHLLGWTGDHPR